MGMRQMNQVASFFAGTALVLLAGCGQTQRHQALEQVCLTDTTRTEAMQAAEDVLGRMHFVIEKADPQHGLLRTRPLSGAQFFEFWRSDNVGAYNSLLANLHTLRRTVELNLSEQKNQQLCISCDVKVQQVSIPEYQISSGSQAYAMFSLSAVHLQVLELRPEQEEYLTWLDRPEDTLLATVILDRIKQQLTSADMQGSSPTTSLSVAEREQK